MQDLDTCAGIRKDWEKRADVHHTTCSAFTGVAEMHLIAVHGGKAVIHLCLAALLLDPGDASLFCILKQGTFWVMLSFFLTMGATRPLQSQLTEKHPTNNLSKANSSFFSQLLHLPWKHCTVHEQMKHVTLGGEFLSNPAKRFLQCDLFEVNFQVNQR